MRRIIIVCEGPTEKEFCKDVLQAYFNPIGIFLHTPLIKKSKGGIVPWQALKRELENHLKQDQEAIVTTLIDYYGIQPKHQFPDWDGSLEISDKYSRITHLENSMLQAISPPLQSRFIPYIQLHEFECLLFNNIQAFEDNLGADEFSDKSELINTLNQFPNPELINDTPDNAPSYRLNRLIIGYNKVVYAAIISQSIGLQNIRNKCPRFNRWIQLLEA